MTENVRPGLANQTLLNKIDKLRELNVRSLELPQLVVVGDQSSGKSSVLESLTGFSFPQAPGLCTRYATQISCRRELEPKVLISIIPRPGADAAVQDRLRSFKRTIPDLTNEILVEIIKEANRAMGIKMTADEADSSLQAFSEDILKIEINGPEQEHFTIIDVPGIFRVPSPPLTTDNDVTLVRNMVESYMQNSRTIILAVLPSNVDISTQEILKMAENADPEGIRTMGVLTKPDLATENATQDAIKGLVLGRQNKLRLGYCVVKNRSADDQSSTLQDRLAQEKAFFSSSTWKPVVASGRCGIASLKIRLSDLLMTISKREFPNVKSDVKRQLDRCRTELEIIGPSRMDQNSQRLYLGKLGSKFQAVTQCALNGYYDSEHVFLEDNKLKLITAITEMNEMFANEFWEKGHKRETSPSNDDDDDDDDAEDSWVTSFRILAQEYPELHDIVELEEYHCPQPMSFGDTSSGTMEHIKQVYQQNRGSELGTFSGSILAVTFKEQTEKWEPLVLAHVGKAITLVHNYIFTLLARICPDKQVRDQVWNTLLIDELRKTYIRAMEQAQFLLQIERHGRPSTYNHYFNSEVQKKRQRRLETALDGKAVTYYTSHNSSSTQKAFPITSLQGLVVDKDNMQQVQEDILDVLASYYKVSRKRFVDTVCRQAIAHFLLDGEQSPLKIFSPELIMGLDADQLETIAGEDVETRDRRLMLESEIGSLEAALKLLRG
ncbi:interferon-induced GTP-binding protein Mx2 [Dothidotthia symphoricarpi CBS 119687]|uniref:Interferon-induced GTP-binding protein Mx2 n=1 Tax=Dothidotthia symphoricarpi CBS 119687 TaxID=1392245 RepID=A0A6A6ANZ9_9PLEO|nr:interferon-induced GTP-binding protein Mx2 [Dothidotthia symphoricarpi CBS 119687]KAF2133256.1 interferon-induced GTP-binding protein Mx2 [Dothidotthia symphoricarpi CBS 119687]